MLMHVSQKKKKNLSNFSVIFTHNADARLHKIFVSTKTSPPFFFHTFELNLDIS